MRSADDEMIELTFCNWGDGTEQEMFEHVFELFHEAYPNITVEVSVHPLFGISDEAQHDGCVRYDARSWPNANRKRAFVG